MPTESSIRLLLADDHEDMRLCVKYLVADTEISVVAAVATGKCAVKVALEEEVDVALLDVRMPGGGGLAALARIKIDKPELPVLMFSVFDSPVAVARAFALGASGYLLKGCPRDEFVQAIRTVRAGGNVWTDEQLSSLAVANRSAGNRGHSAELARNQGIATNVNSTRAVKC